MGGWRRSATTSGYVGFCRHRKVKPFRGRFAETCIDAIIGRMTGRSVGGGIFLIAWALVAAIHGPLTALNWHGYTEKLLRFADRRRLSNGMMTLGMARALGVVFTIVAPFALVLGIIVL